MAKYSFVVLCLLGGIFIEVQGFPASDGQERSNNATSVRIDVYYECLCPGCMGEYPQFPLVSKILGSYVEFHTYPFGNAVIYEKDGKPIVDCQHGEPECYGNKLHACAIDQLKEQQAYLDYNACLMEGMSDNSAADACGKKLKVDSETIKSCAGSQKGEDLLLYYGKESEKVKYWGVPWVLLNKKTRVTHGDLLTAVCDFMKANHMQIPDACK